VTTDPQPLSHIIGRAGGDPKPLTSSKDTPGIAFSLAVDTRTGSGDQRATRWYDVSAWREPLISEVRANVRKGSLIGVSGIAGKKEGESKTFFSMLANDIYRLDKLGSKTGAPAHPARVVREGDPF